MTKKEMDKLISLEKSSLTDYTDLIDKLVKMMTIE